MWDRLLERLTGPTFGSRMRAVAAETGWRAEWPSPGRVQFSRPFGGRVYRLFCAPVGANVQVAVASTATFVARRFPPALETALARRNREVGGWRWQVLHGQWWSWAAVAAEVPLAGLTGRLMATVAGDLLAEVRLLDDGLRTQGLTE